MKRLRSVFLAALLGIAADAQTAPKEIPYFFPKGVASVNTPSLQYKEYLRYLMAQWDCYQGNQNKLTKMIPGNDSYRITFDGRDGRQKIVSTDSFAEGPEYLTIVLDNFVKFIDPKQGEMVRVTTLCAAEIITTHQRDVLVEYLKESQLQSAQLDWEHLKQIETLAVAQRAAQLGIPEKDFRKYLDNKMPGTEVTYREFNQLPKPMRVSDFICKELHFGPTPEIPGILGVAWLNSGVVYYNPEAVVRDYVVGEPHVLMHEIIHANTNMQSFPIAGGFDAELIASLPEMLLPENRIDFFFHGYAQPLRELAWVYAGFNSKQAYQEIFRLNFGGAWLVDEEKWNRYFGMMETIKPTLLDVIEKKVLPEFYGNILFWMALNATLNDDHNAVFDVIMAQNFDPVILGGHAKTMEWLNTNKQQISEIADRAWGKLKNPNQGADGSMGDLHAPRMWVDAYLKAFSASDRKEIESYFRAHPDELRELQKDHTKVFQFVRDFKAGHVSKGDTQ